MTAYTHRFMVVADAHRANAKSLVKTIADSQGPGSADGMFDVGANASGAGTPTHWISSGLIDAGFASLLGNASATYSVYQSAGGTTVTLAQIQALYTASPLGTYIRSDAQGSEDACLTAIGLKLVRGTP